MAAPCESEARALIERLPELLPGDPQSAIILEQALSEAYATEAGKTVVENSEGEAKPYKPLTQAEAQALYDELVAEGAIQ